MTLTLEAPETLWHAIRDDLLSTPEVERAAVVVEFVDPLVATDGTRYVVRVCGGPRADGTWVGWLEFVAMRHSPERARVSWAIVRWTHRAGGRLAALVARRSPTGRIGRKAEQMASLDEAIGDIARTTQRSLNGFCPLASRVVANV